MNRTTRLLALWAGTAVVLSAAGVAGAEESKVTVIKAGPALNDMKVARDKETGKLRAPTDAELADLQASRVTIAPHILDLVRPVTVLEVRADGSAVAKRSLADMDNLVITTGAGGKPVLQHSRSGKAPAAPTINPPKE
jgi:hypothetical protein